MKNRKNLLVFILSISLAAIVTASLAILITENYVLAETAKSPSVQTSKNTAKAKRTTLDSALSTYTTAISVILSAIGGVATYSINESWKRRQYLEEKIKDFEDKKETINVRKMLSTELQCVELFPFLEKPTHRFVIVEDCLWAEALLECKCNETLKEEYYSINKDDENFYQQKAAKKACIRDNFNRFLNHLQQFEKMVESRIINPKTLKTYLDPWFEFIDKANDEVTIKCPSSGEYYTPKKALLEYIGLLEEESLSVTQKDVRRLVLQFRLLSSFKLKQTASTQACEIAKTPPSQIIILK